MELERTLLNLSKDKSQSMEDNLCNIKQIADSLASIGSPVSDMDLVTLPPTGVDEYYHILATTLSYGTSSLTFDDLWAKLPEILEDQRHLRSLATISSVSSSTAQSNKGHNNGDEKVVIL